jgi:hypothetical protein
MRIEYDIFPAHASVAPASYVGELVAHPPIDGTAYLQTSRVIIFALQDVQVLMIAQDTPDGAQVVFQERIAEFDIDDVQYFGTTVSGKRFAFKKDTNCGCGSRLRSWNPYKTLSSIKDPKF